MCVRNSDAVRWARNIGRARGLGMLTTVLTMFIAFRNQPCYDLLNSLCKCYFMQNASPNPDDVIRALEQDPNSNNISFAIFDDQVFKSDASNTVQLLARLLMSACHHQRIMTIVITQKLQSRCPSLSDAFGCIDVLVLFSKSLQLPYVATFSRMLWGAGKLKLITSAFEQAKTNQKELNQSDFTYLCIFKHAPNSLFVFSSNVLPSQQAACVCIPNDEVFAHLNVASFVKK